MGALLERALGLSTEHRKAFLERECADDPTLLREILSLLDAGEGAEAYLDDLSARVVAPALAALIDAPTADVREGLCAALAGHYRIEQELAGAGMSRVFVAEDLRLARRVVIKVLPPETIPAAGSARFQREIELAARLQHPCIVPVLTADAIGGASYYTMPFIEGESLRDRVLRERALPIEEAVRIWRDVLDALGHAHAHGVIHRDIKPGNILLTGRHALVVDFGIARAVEEAGGDVHRTAPGLAIGTPAYMAPEQALGSPDADERVDIYQAGLVMFEMLAGRLPFEARSPHDALVARVAGEPTPLRRPDVPEPLRALVMRCLARLPADRPPNAQAVLSALDVPLGGEARPERGVPVRLRSPRRFVLPAGAVAVAVAALGVAMATALHRAGESSTEMGAIPPTIAVLPLVDLTGDPQDDPVVDGLTEELTSVLGRSANLRIVATTSVSALQGLGLGVRQIADSLHVSHVLEGSVQREGSRIRMLVRLVDAADGSTRWSESYDREFGAVLDVQADVARAVARELAAQLSSGATAPAAGARSAPDIAAHEWYLRGMDLSLLRSGTAAQQGIEYLQRAIAVDSTYAAAYAGLARLYLQLWNAAPAEQQQTWLRLARESADHAAVLDASDPEALAALGWIRLVDRDYDGSEAAFTRALVSNPSVPRGHEGLARLYMMLGRPAEQLVEARLGLALDPYSHSAIREMGLALATSGRCEESLDQLERLKLLTPPAAVAGVVKGQCYASRHMWPEAIAEFQWAADQGAAFALAFLGYSLARAARRDEAADILDDMLSGRRESHGAFGIATVYAGLGDFDQAFAWLDRAVDDNAVNPYLMHPIFADLQSDPRFAEVRKRLGLPPA